MGYRGTLISEDIPVDWSKDFKERWKDWVDLNPIRSKLEVKSWYALLEDVQGELKNTEDYFGHERPMYFVILWEDGRIDSVDVTVDSIKTETLRYPQ